MSIEEIHQLQPDEKGIVTVLQDGTERRFLKEKLLSWLERSPIGYSESITMPVVKKAVRIKTVKAKPVTIKKKPQGYHVQRPVIAILPGGEEKQFPSRKKAADTLNIDVTGITNALKGRQCKVKGFMFKEAV